MYNFSILDYTCLSQNSVIDETVVSPLFSTEWLNFLLSWRGFKPVVIQISKNTVHVGYLCGVETKILGVRLFGSPLPGCLAPYMGFSLNDPSVEISILIDEIVQYLKKKCGYLYITISDYKISKDVLKQCKNKYQTELFETYILDIDKTADEVKKGFSKTYRNYINYFVKQGGTIEEDYTDEFIEIHNKQLVDVYERDGQKSPNLVTKYKKLLESTKSKDLVYCIKAAVENKPNIASSIYLYGGEWAYFLTNASFVDFMNYRPNQSLMWTAIQHLQIKGIKKIDLVGPGQYKAYFGAEHIEFYNITYTPLTVLYKAVMLSKKLYYASFTLKMKMSKIYSVNSNK